MDAAPFRGSLLQHPPLRRYRNGRTAHARFVEVGRPDRRAGTPAFIWPSSASNPTAHTSHILTIATPVGLHQHGVDLCESDGFGVVVYGLDERAEAQVVDVPQSAIRGPQDECHGVIGECVRGQSREFELVLDMVG